LSIGAFGYRRFSVEALLGIGAFGYTRLWVVTPLKCPPSKAVKPRITKIFPDFEIQNFL
jgi:hypothetical protein